METEDNQSCFASNDCEIPLIPFLPSQEEIKDLWFELAAEIIDNSVPDLVCV